MDNWQSVKVQQSQTLISDTVSEFWFGVIYSFILEKEMAKHSSIRAWEIPSQTRLGTYTTSSNSIL